MGFKTHVGDEFPTNTNSLTNNQQLPSAKVKQIVETLNNEHNTRKFSNNLVFLLHSLPTLSQHTQHFERWYQDIQSYKDSINASIVYCKTDIDLKKQRVEGRYELADEEQKKIMESNGDVDDTKQQQIERVYEKLENTPGFFDAILMTTSTKQAVPNIMRMLGIQFSFPKIMK
eukprot:TRINITY_DN2282_c0_g1_i2.p1 TRINITY_DN2282_c0_g1~~TRINITY_DN2282_c0_g1_i2.p1  ORF type:complete len:173 (+),score=35.22 TRINITY_DN2282_c0_g1_i2:330-848(+)